MSTRKLGVFLAVCLCAALCAQLTWAQGQSQQPSQPPAQPGGGGAGRTPTPTPTTPTPSPTPTQPSRQPTFQDIPRAIFLSGKVMMEDGTPPAEPVLIARFCGGNQRNEDYTDSKGRFSFEVGRNTRMFADASIGSGRDPFDSGGFGGDLASSGRGSTGGFGQDQRLLGCELRAILPGFRSDIVNLTGRRALDNPDVGTIILRRVGGVEGTTISATSLQAPKDAKKAYEKGLDANKKRKWKDAQRELEKAVAEYPKYAAAWHELGVAHQQQNQMDEARKAYAQALEADPKFIKPYLQLALLAAGEKKWNEVADTTDRMVRLNPIDFPQAFLMNSIANLNLRRPDVAEKSAREALKLDPNNRMPKVQHVLGLALANKGDYAGAVEHIKTYLELVPDASDAEVVKKQLSELQQLSVQKAAPNQ